MSDQNFVYVLGATYDSLADAQADYDAVRQIYATFGASNLFDAAVVEKTGDGKVKINKRFEQDVHHDRVKGLEIGLATGVLAALFPPIGIGAALAVGGVGGAAIGTIVGHVQSGMGRGDLKQLGDMLDAGQAGLIVVYEANVADQVEKTIKAVNKFESKINNTTADALAAEIRDAS